MRLLLPRMALRFAWNALLRRPPGAGIPTQTAAWGVPLSDLSCRDRSEGVFRAFFAGVDVGARRFGSAPEMPGHIDPLYHPFCQEGAAMGRSLARSLSFRRQVRLGDGNFSRDEPFAFLRVIGVGFALGLLRTRNIAAVARASEGFGNYGPLVQDGYGFCTGLFRWRGALVPTLKSLDTLTGFERHSALSGLGRSLWFRFMDHPEEGLAEVRSTQDVLPLLGGMGLAAVFTFPDELERAYGVVDRLDGDERRAFLKGVRIALFVRRRDQEELLAHFIGNQREDFQRRARQDLEVALRAHEAWGEDPEYIRRFHEACFEA